MRRLPPALTPTLVAVLGAALGWANPWLHFPPASLGAPLGLAWLGFISASDRSALFRGWVAGTLVCLAVIYWFAVPVGVYGGLSWLIALPCPVAACMVLGCYYAAFTWLMRRLASRLCGPLLCLAAAVAWTALENASAVLFSGMPWATLSASFAFWPILAQGASLVGAFALSGLYAALAVSVLLWRGSRGSLILAAVLLVVLGGWGAWRLSADFSGLPRFTVALVQGDIDQSLKWEPAYQSGTVDKYVALSRKALESAPADLVIWPETAMPFYFQDHSPLSEAVRSFAEEVRTPLLLGSPAYDFDLDTGRTNLYNRAWLLHASGSDAGRYDKEHLVPFGEYTPMSGLLSFLDALLGAVGDFRPGVNVGPLRTSNLAMGMLICYEVIFPDLARNRVEQGANVLVSISNDAWFGETSARLQHLAQALMRVVEQGRSMVRATNTGITVLADPRGRLTAVAPSSVETVLIGQAPLIEERTPFFHAAPFIKWGTWLAALGLAAWTFRRPPGDDSAS